MILSLCPAPALDSTVHLPVLELGESLRIDPPVVRAGGKGLNVARVLASRGRQVRLLASLGGATGDRLAAEFSATAVASSWLPVAAPTRMSTAMVEASGRTTVLNERAGALSAAEWERWFAALGDFIAAARSSSSHSDAVAAPGASAGAGATRAAGAAPQRGIAPDAGVPGPVATVSGSWPEATPADVVRETVQALVRAGIYTVADTSGPLLLVAAEAGASLLKPNEEELRQATGEPTLSAGLARLFDLGAGSVLLSRGEAGMSHYTRSDRLGLHARLDAVLSGNPTGAGDAGVAGWLAAVEPLGRAPEGAERSAALAQAVAWSASAVEAPLAGDLGPRTDALLERVLFTSAPTALE